MKLEISFESKILTQKLTDINKNLKDFSKPFNDIGDKLTDFFTNEVIQSQGSLVGERWPPLSPTTLSLRRSRSGYYAQAPERTDATLIWTGRLRKGFKKTVSPRQLVISNTVKYFPIHQLGGGNVPRRKILAVNDKVVKIIVDLFNGFIKRLLK